MSNLDGGTTTAIMMAVIFSLAVTFGEPARARAYALIDATWIVVWLVLTVAAAVLTGLSPAVAA